MRADYFTDVMRKAIDFGNDTDTNAYVPVELAGLRFGFRGLPKMGLTHLKGQILVE